MGTAFPSKTAEENEHAGAGDPASCGRAIVLTGGGARAAYQVGLLRYLGKRYPDLTFPIITGISAGAINAVYLASHPGNLREASHGLAELWRNLSFEDVFETSVFDLFKTGVRTVARLASGGLLRRDQRGLLHTEPLRRLLHRQLDIDPHDGRIVGIARNLERGRLRSAALATVCYGTGQTVTWVEGKQVPAWQRVQRQGRSTALRVEHVMASAALPLLFPAIELVPGEWYGDGGIRLAAPISPALHLGADAVLAVSTRYQRSQEEASTPATDGYPPPAQIVGNLMNAIFLDVLDRDVRRLERLNGLLLELPEDQRGPWRPIDVMLMRPSRDLGKLVRDFEPRLPGGFRFLTRGLGTRRTKSPDFLSLLMFQSDYLSTLIEIGEQDAAAQVERLDAWVERSA